MFENREKLENIIGLPVLSRKFENDIFLNLKKKFAILERKRRKKYEDEEKAGDLVATQMQLLDISPELNFLLKGKKI